MFVLCKFFSILSKPAEGLSFHVQKNWGYFLSFFNTILLTAALLFQIIEFYLFCLFTGGQFCGMLLPDILLNVSSRLNGTGRKGKNLSPAVLL